MLLADGTTKPIEDVQLGDEVKATDPEAGTSTAEPVTLLHANNDSDLTDVTVRDTASGKKTTLHTTEHHPFWDATENEWVDAANLVVGHELRVASDKEQVEGDGTGAGLGGGGPGSTDTVSVTVTEVEKVHGTRLMRDLTVADIHTYYVIAGDTPVLVHNTGCSGKVYRQLSYEDRVRFDNGDGLQPRGTVGSIIDHILNRPTKHISASVTLKATERFASDQGLVEIDVEKAIAGGARFVDHNNVMQAATRSGDSCVVRDARRAKGVLFIGSIPYDAMTLIRGR